MLEDIKRNLNLGILPSLKNSSKEDFEKLMNFSYLSQMFSEDFEEIVIHSPLCVTKRYRGHQTTHSLDISREELDLSFELLCFRESIKWNRKKSFTSAKTIIHESPIRLSLLHSKTGCGQHKYFLRKQARQEFSLESFFKFSKGDILKEIFLSRKNIIFSGASGSGKTSLVQSLLSLIPKKEDVLILEDSKEIKSIYPHWTCLHSTSSEELKEFCSYSVRMFLDRIILGEIRSSEIYPFILSMNTGLKGFVSTLHANSALDTLSRLGILFEFYAESSSLKYETVMKLICSQIDYVVYLENKEVVEIIEILNYDQKCIYKNVTF